MLIVTNLTLINIQKIRHFTHFEIIKHSFGIITPVVKVTVPEKEIKKIKSKKLINKYITMRDNTLSYLIQNEKEITLKLFR